MSAVSKPSPTTKGWLSQMTEACSHDLLGRKRSLPRSLTEESFVSDSPPGRSPPHESWASRVIHARLCHLHAEYWPESCHPPLTYAQEQGAVPRPGRMQNHTTSMVGCSCSIGWWQAGRKQTKTGHRASDGTWGFGQMIRWARVPSRGSWAVSRPSWLHHHRFNAEWQR